MLCHVLPCVTFCRVLHILNKMAPINRRRTSSMKKVKTSPEHKYSPNNIKLEPHEHFPYSVINAPHTITGGLLLLAWTLRLGYFSSGDSESNTKNGL